MDLEQRYIEVSNFDFDEWFIGKIMSLPFKIRESLMYDISRAAENLPEVEGWYQEVYGVIPSINKFYVIDYIKEQNDIPIILDINFVDSDEYLDAILDNKTIKSYYNVERTHKHNIQRTTEESS